MTTGTKSGKSSKCGTRKLAIVYWICRGGEKNGGGDGGGEPECLGKIGGSGGSGNANIQNVVIVAVTTF